MHFAPAHSAPAYFAPAHFASAEIKQGKSGVNRLYQIEQHQIQRRIREEEEILLFIKTILTKGLI